MTAGVVLLGRRKGALRAARHLGLRALVVTDGPEDDDPDALRWSRPFRDDAALRTLVPELLSAASVRAVIPTTEGSVVPAARLRAHLGVDGMDVATAVRCTDKARMKTAVRAAGVACADHVTAEEGLDAGALVARLGLPMVIKARASSGGRGTRFARTRAEVPARLDDGRMAESFVHGTEMSIESFVVDGTPVFENPTEYLRPGWANVLPAALPAATWDAVRAMNRAALRALGIEHGMAHVELYLEGSRVVFGEVAARAPGGHLMPLLEHAYAFDPWEALLRIACGEPPTVRRDPVCAAAVWLFHPGPGRVARVEGVDAARAAPGVVELPLRVDVGDIVDARVGVGQEIGHVLVTGRDRDEAAARVTAARDLVTVEVSG